MLHTNGTSIISRMVEANFRVNSLLAYNPCKGYPIDKFIANHAKDKHNTLTTRRFCTHILGNNPVVKLKIWLIKSATQSKTVQRFVCASGGTRTHKPVRASDFKSDAYANSATEAANNYYAIYHRKEQAQRVAKQQIRILTKQQTAKQQTHSAAKQQTQHPHQQPEIENTAHSPF